MRTTVTNMRLPYSFINNAFGRLLVPDWNRYRRPCTTLTRDLFSAVCVMSDTESRATEGHFYLLQLDTGSQNTCTFQLEGSSIITYFCFASSPLALFVSNSKGLWRRVGQAPCPHWLTALLPARLNCQHLPQDLVTETTGEAPPGKQPSR